MNSPKLKHVNKYAPLYPIGKFPSGFDLALGREIVYILATREPPSVEGPDWEQIFARCVGAKWRPSNIGLDDIQLGQMAWSAKSVKNKNPFKTNHVRLISGRNSLDYSFDVANVHAEEPEKLGSMILDIWNSRLTEVRSRFTTTRTVVLIKGPDLTTLSVFEEETLRFEPSDYDWEWNSNNNLEGYEKGTDVKRFTWQPHGAQFTILTKVPENRLKLRIHKPPIVAQGDLLKAIHFNPSWIEVVND